MASHNEDTVRFTLQQMQKNNIKPEDKVRVGQKSLSSSMNVPNMADNPYVSLADLKETDHNGTEFLEKCVKNWNAWVEMTHNLTEVSK